MRFRPLVFFFLAVLFFLITFFRPLAAQHWSLQDNIVITDANIVDVRTGEVHPDQVIVIERNKILDAGPRKTTRYPRNAPTNINARGAYLIPGLWDMHVHLKFG